MANPETLATLRTRCQERVDKVNSTFVSTAEWTRLINQAYARLYAVLTSKYPDYYSTSANLAVTSGVEYTALPSSFYKATALFYLDGTTRRPMEEFNLHDLGSFANPWPSTSAIVTAYRLVGANVYWFPKPGESGTVELWYIPQVTRLASDSDVISAQVVDGWEEFIINDVAAKVRVKEERDPRPHWAANEEFLRHVEADAASRNVARAPTVVDVERGVGGWPWT